ncbi:MAG: phosphoenolpyruvate synthase [Gammaproteobacteria bacterium]|nr:phosphoenolpyruvate synthase [Gammaproteobacteria bacterium]
MTEQILWFEKLSMDSLPQVGGKNASLGEMISKLSDAGVRVPGGFATTADAFRDFIAHNQLKEPIEDLLGRLDVSDVVALARAGQIIRDWIMQSPLPEALEQAVKAAYASMSINGQPPAVAIRSSATAEDLPDASFAGQQETYLNVVGIDNVLHYIHAVFASLYNDRAISYRVHQGFEHESVALSAGIQRMARSDMGAAGVMFTLDTESGFRDVVFITSSYGLGEMVVQGAVNPDEFYVHKENLTAGRPAVLRRTLGSKAIKMVYGDNDQQGVNTIDVPESKSRQFSLTETQVEELARYALIIEQHYGRPMDIEWALDGEDGKLYILQARPETVESRNTGRTSMRFQLLESGAILCQGRAIGQRIGSGEVKVIKDASEMSRIEEGDVLVTDMTDPDWEPIMQRAAAIVTNRGGRTCHAAIIAREMGIPAVVGCGDATEKLSDGEQVTVSCAEGDDGMIYQGHLRYEVHSVDIDTLPELPTKIMMNVGNPGHAFSFASIPNAGVGLARLEFVINNMIGIHPRALLEYDQLPDDLQQTIAGRIAGYANPVGFYVEKLVEGMATLAASFKDKPVIIRMSDFKSNEYANLIGGPRYEPEEENPMLGFRGASRYISKEFRRCFELECEAIRRVREDMGFTNVEVMIPFVRTLEEAEAVINLLAENGLERGKAGLRIIMMCEIPSNALLAKEFLQYFDGFSIGSNDMTQLTLGLDRDSALVADKFDERNPAVKKILEMAITAAIHENKYIGICGQGPSDYPELAAWLLQQGISSISLNPDTVVDTWKSLGELNR